MARIKIPVLDESVSTDNPSGALRTLATGSIGVMLLFALVAGGQWMYNRARSVAGVGEDTNPVPGV